ncbi:hypothetical protein [Castellaniella sp.]|uniref:hypothetical protein n=1 Tax=Castellaniella sp. TaxID=1955812 RepID=UPI002AFDCB0B|nr:hypothetical protein [Castellaniella sp.]
MEWLDTLRYDYPRLFRVLVIVALIISLVGGFMIIPEGSMARAIGITDVQHRVTATFNGLYWSVRAHVHQDGPEQHVQLYGNIEGIDETTQLVVSIPIKDQFQQKTFRLANTEIIDVYGAVHAVGALRQETARFDVYDGNNVVVWIRGTPLNVKLIESGVARPAPKPPSNIFDRAFAAYYWRLAKAQ